MDTYWLSFRIADTASYERRYEALISAIGQVADQSCWWFETTSFYLFQSEHDIDAIAAHIGASINQSLDLVVIGKTDYKTGRVVGRCDDGDIFKLVPFMKKA